MPFATTTSVLGPAGVPFGMVNLVDEAAPGATETDVQLLVTVVNHRAATRTIPRDPEPAPPPAASAW